MDGKLIINADDYGLTESCTKAIAQAFDKGLISSTTACANGEYIQEAFLLAKEKCFLDKIGIHINLTEGRPLTEKISNDSFFCQGGVFHGKIDRLKKPSQEQLDEIRKEIEAQIERLLSLGYTISHADSHHHIHTCVYFVDVIKDVLFSYGIKKIRLHRNIGEIPFYKKIVKNWYNKKLKKQGFITCDSFGSINDFATTKKRGEICEIMVHPDYDKNGTLIDRILHENGENIGEPLECIQSWINKEDKISYKDL